MSGLVFGALSPQISEQLDSIGVRYDEHAIEHCQKDADAIVRLAIRGLITGSQKEAAFRKLVRRIDAAVIPTGDGGAA